MNDMTHILNACSKGEDPKAAEQLLPLVYEELRRLARARMAKQPPGHTLQPTALVHEAWIRLLGKDDNPQNWNNRNHFFAAAAEAMRRIIVERARRYQAQKRGSGRVTEELNEMNIVLEAPSEEILKVHESLDRLEDVDPKAAQLVKLRYFVGLTVQEAAESLGLSLRNTERLWSFSRVWLHREIGNIDV